MSITTNRFLISATVAGLLLGGAGCQCPDHAMVRQPRSQLAKVGSHVEFESGVAIHGNETTGFNWSMNCKPLDAETAKELGIKGVNGPTLTIDPVKTAHVGFYQCVIESATRGGKHSVAVTEPAELLVYEQSVVTVYGTPIGGAGSVGPNNCPPKYVGYVNFRKPASPYGWKLTNQNVGGTASDPNPNRNDTVVRYFGSTLSKNGCGTKSVPVPSGTDAYRFTIYFTNAVPSGPYSIKLDGFDP